MAVKKKNKAKKKAKRRAKVAPKKKIKKNNAKTIKKEVEEHEQQINEEEIKEVIKQNIKQEETTESDFIKTGFNALDNNLNGGFPSPSAIIVEGEPNEYKVPFLIGFAANALKRGKRAIYVCTNDFPENIIKMGREIGYDLSKVDFIDSYSWMIGKESNFKSASALNPSKLLEVFSDTLKKDETECIVFDSLSTFFLYQDKRSVEKFVQMLVALVKDLNAFLLLSVETGTYSDEMEATLKYLTDGVIKVGEGKIEIEYIEGIKINKKEMRLDFSKKGVEIN